MIKAIIFDMFGTVVDWRGTIIYKGSRFAPFVNWEEFAWRWMEQYSIGINYLDGWKNLDSILTQGFFNITAKYGFNNKELSPIMNVWSHLNAWPDSVKGFDKLWGKTKLVAFSNANTNMLIDLICHTDLPFDDYISAEHAQCYKPDPRIYQKALELLQLPPNEVLLVASHCFDLNAANKEGIRTALITRKGEPGSDPKGLDHEPLFISTNLDVFADEFLKQGEGD